MKDNKIVQVDGRNGPANENRLCVKGRFGYDYVMNPERLTKPLIRREDAPKAGDMDMRFMKVEDVFREATWEEAMELAASGLKKIHDDKGGSALAGFGSAKGSNEEAYLFQKFIRQGSVQQCRSLYTPVSCVIRCSPIGRCWLRSRVCTVYRCQQIRLHDRNRCTPGAKPSVAATYFKQAAKKGKKLIIMDPRGQDLMRHASHALRFKPGTDVAMLNAILHTIIEEELYDEQYIQANATGFEALKEKVKDFSPEAMEEVCGIEADVLRDVARTYATSERSIIFWGMGVSQHSPRHG